jgi:hypothetical protein
MTPTLPTATPAATVPPTSVWLLLALVLTTLLAVGRWTQPPAPRPTASQPALVHPARTTRRAPLARPAQSYAGTSAALAATAL